jgi:hypothetical protein
MRIKHRSAVAVAVMIAGLTATSTYLRADTGTCGRCKHYAAVHRCAFQQHILLCDSRSILFRTDQRHHIDDIQSLSQRTAGTDGCIHNKNIRSVAQAR